MFSGVVICMSSFSGSSAESNSFHEFYYSRYFLAATDVYICVDLREVWPDVNLMYSDACAYAWNSFDVFLLPTLASVITVDIFSIGTANVFCALRPLHISYHFLYFLITFSK